MLHAKFQDHQPFGSGEEDRSFKVFNIYGRGGPGAGADNPLGSNFLQKHKSCQLSHLLQVFNIY